MTLMIVGTHHSLIQKLKIDIAVIFHDNQIYSFVH